MYDPLRSTLVLSILIFVLVCLEDKSLSTFGVKNEAEGTSNNTLPNASANTEKLTSDLASIYDEALANATADAKKMQSSLQSIYSNQFPTNFDPLSNNGNASLRVQVEPTVIPENTQTALDVRGHLLSTDIQEGQEIDIDLLSNGSKFINGSNAFTTIDNVGRFHSDYTIPPNLTKGDYFLVVKPTQQVAPGLNSTTYIKVITPPITFDQVVGFISTLILVVPPIVAAIIYLPRWWLKKRELKTLGHIFMEIDNTYSQNRSNVHEVEVRLENLRKQYLVLLSKGKLDQNTFDLVERRIIYFIGKDKST